MVSQVSNSTVHSGTMLQVANSSCKRATMCKKQPFQDQKVQRNQNIHIARCETDLNKERNGNDKSQEMIIQKQETIKSGRRIQRRRIEMIQCCPRRRPTRPSRTREDHRRLTLAGFLRPIWRAHSSHSCWDKRSLSRTSSRRRWSSSEDHSFEGAGAGSSGSSMEGSAASGSMRGPKSGTRMSIWRCAGEGGD